MDYSKGEMLNDRIASESDIDHWLQDSYCDDKRRYEQVRDICYMKNVLDFGCGFGGFLQLMKDEALSVTGVELGDIERNYLTNKRIDVYKDIELSNKKYDVITLFHCFEHLENPKDWLLIFEKYLTEGGLLVIEVPNGNDALLELYKSTSFADFTYWSAHLSLFTLDGLSKLISQCGKYEFVSKGQVQRYSLGNTLYWLSDGKPGGHNVYTMFNDEDINGKYVEILSKLEMCDTLFFILKKGK